MDTLKAIQVFVEIHQQGSLSKAAEKLMLSRAMVSRYLEFLERRFGTRLMQRNTRRIALTQAGEEALIYCNTILDQEEKLKNLSAEKRTSGRLRISGGHYIAREYLLEASVAFQKTMPDVEFDIFSHEHTVDLIARNLDLAVRVGKGNVEGYSEVLLGEMGSWLVATPEYLAQSPDLNSPEQLLDHRCLVHSYLNDNQWPLMDSQGNKQAYPLGDVFHSNDIYVLQQMVHKHQGVAMLPIDVVVQDVIDGKLIRVLSDYEFENYQAWGVYVSKVYMPLILKNFLLFLPQYFEQKRNEVGLLVKKAAHLDVNESVVND